MLKGKKYLTVVIAIVVLTGLSIWLFRPAPRVDYNADIKPILNKNCIACHGGVKKQAGFSLLFREDALGPTESGKPAIIPGDPDGSEMIRRLTLEDEEERMPYKKHPLPKEEIALLRNWIKQGAKWGQHWAYTPVDEPTVPKGKRRFFGLVEPLKPDWVQNNIDYFIFDKLQQEKLQPSPEADKASLLRRVSLDLTGLPPNQELASRFLQSNNANAYEQLVDSLLASSSYGERWTTMWLDLARFSDTKGYERDGYRSIWRYRDWLIQAFNDDMPYDSFLIAQMAGDLLPNPTDAAYIATAFHRNTMTNDEGGTDNEEYRTAAVMDRVNTTWQALMGTTFACVQCHSHPYDPFRHEDYYKFMAYFNNTRDEDTYEEFPVYREYKGVDSLRFIELKKWLKKLDNQTQAAEIVHFLKTCEPVTHTVVADAFTNAALVDTKWASLRKNGSFRFIQVDLGGSTQMQFRYSNTLQGGTWHVRLDSLNGQELLAVKLKPIKGWTIETVSIPAAAGTHDVWFYYENPGLTSSNQPGPMFSWFRFTSDFPGKNVAGYDSARSWYQGLLNSSTNNFNSTPIMLENPSSMRRRSFVFERGNWMVKGQEVQPGVPAELNPLPANAPANRLGLVRWMTDKKNPLVSRTMVNRIWEQLFGHGIAESLEDLGTQGIPPTHRELLDYLAWKFMNEDEWHLKKLLKEIVMSATYQQQSNVSPELLQKDPANKLYARGPRVRLSAEQIRDQALAVSGLLSFKQFGPSVMPFQPNGIWLTPYNNDHWKMSEGEDRFRRSVYTYWKRTAPYPFMMMYDGVSRDVCVSRRINTNTPLQALVTLNDSSYLEMSRNLAYLVQEKAGKSNVKAQIDQCYQNMFYKPISQQKLGILEGLYEQSKTQFQAEPDKACEIIGLNNEHNNPETAALVVVVNAMLNLDEWVTKN